jgi:hypothetical protein
MEASVIDQWKRAELRALAEKATPGPWQRSGVRQNVTENCIMVGPDNFLIVAIPHGAHPNDHAGAFNDAGFIAACDPQTILALLDAPAPDEAAIRVAQVAALRRGLSLAGGWREAIVELEDFCSEPVRLKNMIAAANQLDDWVEATRAALARAGG